MLFDRPRLIVARVHTPQRVVSQTRKLSGSYRTTPSPLIFEKKRNRIEQNVSERARVTLFLLLQLIKSPLSH